MGAWAVGHAAPTEAESLEPERRRMIVDALKTTRGNKALASKLLQVSERVVNYKVKKLGIDCARLRD